MLVTALFSGGNVPVDMLRFLVYQIAAAVVNLHFVRGQHHNLPVVQIVNILRVGQQSRHIAGNQIFILAQANHQRAILAHGVKPLRLVNAQNPQRVRALQLVHQLNHRVQHIALVIIFH